MSTMTPADRVVACLVALLLVLMLAGTGQVFNNPSSEVPGAHGIPVSGESPHMP